MKICISRTASHFYPRPPCGGRPVNIRVIAILQTFLSTPSVRRATVGKLVELAGAVSISIHALRAEGDAFGLGGSSDIP